MMPGNVSKEIRVAFQELTAKNPLLVTRFKQTFHERRAIPGEPEAKAGIDGLSETLAGLLGMFPDESRNGVEEKGDNGDSTVTTFAGEFSAALDKLVIEHPTALILFKKHQQEDSRSTREFLAALLRMYAEHEVGYSY